MFNEIFELINKPLGIFKFRLKIMIGLSIILASAIYVFYPVILNKDVIEVRQSPIIIRLPIEFNKCSINFDRDLEFGVYQLAPSKENTKKYSNDLSKSTNINRTTNLLTIENNLNKSALQKLKVSNVDIYISAIINHPVLIQSIKVDGTKKNLKSFYDKNLRIINKKYINREYIRKDISILLLKYNDSISNYILTFLTISLFPLSLYLLILCTRLYIYSQNYFRIFIKRNYSISDSAIHESITNAHNQYGIDFSKRKSWFRFLQILGPAIGFALTISSLIAGLNPTLQQAQDISIFFESIQIAMISTFIGLIIRIIAIFSDRVNDKLFFRGDNIFLQLKNSPT